MFIVYALYFGPVAICSVIGMILFVAGRIPLPRRRLVLGLPARIAGLLLLVPLATLLGFFSGILDWGPGGPGGEMRGILYMEIGWLLCLVCLILALALAFATGKLRS